MIKRFKTTDGFVLSLIDNVWTDGDLSFPNDTTLDVPFDAHGENLEGTFLPDGLELSDWQAAVLRLTTDHRRGLLTDKELLDEILEVSFKFIGASVAPRVVA